MSTARPWPVKNGFTLLEMLFVLLIVTVIGAAFTFSRPVYSLSFFMEGLVSRCISVQMDAYWAKEEKAIEFGTYSARFDETVYSYPAAFVCSPYTLHYNAKGNISMAGTLHCYKGSQEGVLIFQLGSGRARYEAR